MSTGIKKTLGIVSIITLALTVLYTADVTPVQAEVSDTNYELAADNGSTEGLGCILGSILTALSELQNAQTPVAVTTIIFSMAIDIVECADAAGDYATITCAFDAILEMVSEVSICTDGLCVLSNLFDMIIELINCAEPAIVEAS